MAITNPIPETSIQPYSADIFDLQRTKLFSIINRLRDIHESGSGQYLAVIRLLVDYLSEGFHKEHLAMMNARSSHFAAHLQEHRKFTEKIEEYLYDYVLSDSEMGNNLSEYLKDWVQNHISKVDVEAVANILKVQHPEISNQLHPVSGPKPVSIHSTTR